MLTWGIARDNTTYNVMIACGVPGFILACIQLLYARTAESNPIVLVALAADARVPRMPTNGRAQCRLSYGAVRSIAGSGCRHPSPQHKAYALTTQDGGRR
jgi:hypothetical protein